MDPPWNGALTGLKAFLLWAIILHTVTQGYVWLEHLDDPEILPIQEEDMQYSFNNLNKYGDDTSGCPLSINQTVRVCQYPHDIYLFVISLFLILGRN